MRSLIEKTVQKRLCQAGLNPENLLPLPAPADESCRAYCPHCHSQFTAAAGTCADCGGLELVAFKPSLRLTSPNRQ